MLQRLQSCKSDFTGDKTETSLILEETSEFSELLRRQISGLKARILFEQGFSLNKEKLAGNYLFISCLYILPYLGASRFSIKGEKKKKDIFCSGFEIKNLLVYFEELTIREIFKQIHFKILIYMCKYKNKLFRNSSCKLM